MQAQTEHIKNLRINLLRATHLHQNNILNRRVVKAQVIIQALKLTGRQAIPSLNRVPNIHRPGRNLQVQEAIALQQESRLRVAAKHTARPITQETEVILPHLNPEAITIQHHQGQVEAAIRHHQDQAVAEAAEPVLQAADQARQVAPVHQAAEVEDSARLLNKCDN